MFHKRRLTGFFAKFFAGCAIFACVCLLCAARDSSWIGPSLRMAASHTFRLLSESDLPRQITNSGADGLIWAMRLPVNLQIDSNAVAEAVQFCLDAPDLVAAALSVHAPNAKKPAIVMPLLAQDGMPQLFVPLLPEQGELHDNAGNPLRWRIPDNLLASYSKPRPAPFPPLEPQRLSPQFERALALLGPAQNASSYRGLVEKHAKRYGLNVNLVMAIIHSESNFSPTTISPKSAMGLMQLLPSTASGEVHKFLYGKHGYVNFEQLAQPDINIRYGTAYLHILTNRYFQDIRDKRAQEACVIAAYNMGPNGLLRLYGATPQAAAAKINSMDFEDFLQDLRKRLPMRETRFYLEKVRRMKQHYANAQ